MANLNDGDYLMEIVDCCVKMFDEKRLLEVARQLDDLDREFKAMKRATTLMEKTIREMQEHA